MTLKTFLIVSLLFIFISGTNAQLMDSAWPKFHHNLNNTGQSPYSSNSNGTLKWSYATGSIESTPAIDGNNIIYIGASNGVVSAIYPNGTLKWSYATGGGVYMSSPAISSDGIIYVGTFWDNKLYAIYPNGTLKWSYTVGSWIGSSPTVDDNGVIYFGSRDGYLYAINSNGTLKWQYRYDIYVDIYSSSPAIGSDGTIYIGSLDNYLYAVNSNGTLKWRYNAGDDIYSSPTIDNNGIIYVGSYNSKLNVIYPNGTLKWSYATSCEVDSSPAIYNNEIIYVGDGCSILYAIYPNGSLKWTYGGLGDISSSPAIDNNGVIYIGGSFDRIDAIYPNGTQKWSYTTGNDIYFASPSIDSNGIVYHGSWDGYLYAFESEAPPVPPSEITVSCPIGWCYLAQNYSSKTLQQLDAMYSTNTIAGKFNSTSQKYESKRTGYSFNANVQVQQKEGYYIYFSSPQNVTMTPGTTPSITLKQGWSLTSNYGTSNRTLAELKTSIGANASTAKYYDKNLKLWVSTDSQSVPAMESFFVYCDYETVWNN